MSPFGGGGIKKKLRVTVWDLVPKLKVDVHGSGGISHNDRSLSHRDRVLYQHGDSMGKT